MGIPREGPWVPQDPAIPHILAADPLCCNTFRHSSPGGPKGADGPLGSPEAPKRKTIEDGRAVGTAGTVKSHLSYIWGPWVCPADLVVPHVYFVAITQEF